MELRKASMEAMDEINELLLAKRKTLNQNINYLTYKKKNLHTNTYHHAKDQQILTFSCIVT